MYTIYGWVRTSQGTLLEVYYGSYTQIDQRTIFQKTKKEEFTWVLDNYHVSVH